MPFRDKRPDPSVELLWGDVTAESIQAVLPGVREGLGGNQRASPIFVTPWMRLFFGVAGSCQFRTLPTVRPALYCRHSYPQTGAAINRFFISIIQQLNNKAGD